MMSERELSWEEAQELRKMFPEIAEVVDKAKNESRLMYTGGTVFNPDTRKVVANMHNAARSSIVIDVWRAER